MSIVLGPHQYGKAENRIVRVYRDSPRHEIHDVNVSTALRGAFDPAHLVGDQSAVLATPLMLVNVRTGVCDRVARYSCAVPALAS